jgi:nucleoside-diphosphate-sugar epimerase
VKVLVTGASGLVGQFAVDRLMELKKITVIAQCRNYSSLRATSAKIKVLELDLINDDASQKILSFSPDIIVHCAAQIPTSTVGDEECAQINRKIDENIFYAAQRCASKVVFLSSTAVYENCLVPWSESQSVSPQARYAKQKRLSEIRFSELAVPSISLRITSPYGGCQNAERNVLYKFIHAAISNQVLPVYGLGLRRQNFVFAGDVADLIAYIVSEIKNGLNVSGIFNVAGDSAISMRDLATRIVQLSGKGEVVYVKGTVEDEQFDPHVDMTKTREILKWMPSTRLVDGVQNLITALGG